MPLAPSPRLDSPRHPQRPASMFRFAMLLPLIAIVTGCEGYDRTRPAPTDVHAPAKEVLQRNRTEGVNMADELEHMMELRQQYLDHLSRLEKLYLENGDMARAGWARRQRDETATITVYPYAGNRVPEQTSLVHPDESIPDADKLYADATAEIQSFRVVPLAGALDLNKNKARHAIKTLRQLLRQYPKSDKVDDAAYWIGECYKEYLREEDPDNLLALRYYAWAIELDPKTPHPARFQSAAVYDFRMHDRKRSLEWYHKVLDDNERYHPTNISFSRERIAQLTDDERSKERPREDYSLRRAEPAVADVAPAESGGVNASGDRASASDDRATASDNREATDHR